ncbi:MULTISPECIES: ribbon-helix-helix domain-containing protein [Paenirhodobacter]|uniref:Aryl-sulfate sulfotransferase n=2 Tax=Paenirhodobacter TaxID=1470577 RepID=A0A421BML0_9RHOB|nr:MULTISPECIES: ribbon-helix-helix domain-containing protein [Sinirhodobacter]RLL64309.1 aryl-sulfate sulfotransferase [Sinirhodobacter hankyongi]RWR46931.1 aryl-sulfate sulfotransferase [Sinirhodobacter ferrireducens]
MSRPRKHSLTLHGHRTSVSLEDEFWAGLREMAAERGLGINEIVTEIDDARVTESGLATAIRLAVLRHYRARAGSAG